MHVIEYSINMKNNAWFKTNWSFSNNINIWLGYWMIHRISCRNSLHHVFHNIVLVFALWWVFVAFYCHNIGKYPELLGLSFGHKVVLNRYYIYFQNAQIVYGAALTLTTSSTKIGNIQKQKTLYFFFVNLSIYKIRVCDCVCVGPWCWHPSIRQP